MQAADASHKSSIESTAKLTTPHLKSALLMTYNGTSSKAWTFLSKYCNYMTMNKSTLPNNQLCIQWTLQLCPDKAAPGNESSWTFWSPGSMFQIISWTGTLSRKSSYWSGWIWMLGIKCRQDSSQGSSRPPQSDATPRSSRIWSLKPSSTIWLFSSWCSTKVSSGKSNST